MRILIFGAGALGSLLAAFLASKHEVTLVGRAAHMAAIRQDGLKVEGVRKFDVKVEAKEAVDGSEAPELVVLSVKSYDTQAAIPSLQKCVDESTRILTVQNGLGNYEALQAAFPRNPVLAASCVCGAMIAAPGRVLYQGGSEMLIGGTVHQMNEARELGKLFRTAGLNALGLPDVRGILWQKAIVNAAINPLSALFGKTNGELLADPTLVERMRRAVDEGAAVARAQKFNLPERDVFAYVRKVAESTSGNKSSMFQDLTKGHRTEIDFINGAIVEAGRRLGIPTPENAALLAAVKEREGRR